MFASLQGKFKWSVDQRSNFKRLVRVVVLGISDEGIKNFDTYAEWAAHYAPHLLSRLGAIFASLAGHLRCVGVEEHTKGEGSTLVLLLP